MPDALVERLRTNLEERHWPRLHCSLLIALSGAAAFLVSFTLLAAGLHSMALRYGLAALGGYTTFILLIRAWVRWKAARFDGDPLPDIINLADLPLPSGSRAPAAPPSMFTGGRTGGGGASEAWGPAPVGAASGSSSSRSSGGGFSLDLDADDLWWLILAAAAALAGVVAVGYVIYLAPTLLAEAAVDVAIAGRVYQGLRKRDASHWTTHVIRRTALAAVILVVSATLAGYALQRITPDARSIGGVWHAVAR